jgi:hypothetical protein
MSFRRNRKGYHSRPTTDNLLRHAFIKDQQNERNVKLQLKEHIDRAQRNNDYEERWSNSEDETEIDPREVTIGASNGDKTQRQLFHQLQQGHDEHERDIDKRRQDYIKMNFEHEQNKEKMLKLVEEKRKQALRRADIAAREKKESELNLTAKRLEPDDKPTPAPRGRSSLRGQSGGVIHVRHSPSSSNQSTPFGSAHRPNHSNHSPLVRSREHTPNHSRQSSGNLLPRTPNSRNHDGLSVPNRVTEYPPSSSSDEDNPLPDHIPLIPIVSDPSSDSENDYSKPFRAPNPTHHQPQHSDPSISHVSHEFDHHSTHTQSNPHIMHSTPSGMIARLTDQKLSMQDISSIPPLNNSQIHSNQPHSNYQQQQSSVQQYHHQQNKPINVNPPAPPTNHRADNQMPEIRKYKKKFSSDINSASLWGVNLLIGTKSGLMLLDRQGQGKVYGLVEKRNFQQIEVVESINVVLTISGKKNKMRVYFLSWLRNKILKNDPAIGKKPGYSSIGDLEGCTTFKLINYQRLRFLVIAQGNVIQMFAWAPKPYHKFMPYKVFTDLPYRPLIVDMTVEEDSRMKILYGSEKGFHAIDIENEIKYDLYIPSFISPPIIPHQILILPESDGMELLLCYNDEGVYVNTFGTVTKEAILNWGENPLSVSQIKSSNEVMGWGEKAIEIRSIDRGLLNGVFMHKRPNKLKFLTEKNDKVFFASVQSPTNSQVYFMTLNNPGSNRFN